MIPELRPFLSVFYKLLKAPSLVLKCLTVSQLSELHHAVGDDLCVARTLKGGDVQRGWTLQSLGSHRPVKSKEEILSAPLRHSRCWTRFLDFSSRSVSVDKSSAKVAALLRNAFCSGESFQFAGFAPDLGLGAADAWASETRAGVGGWWSESLVDKPSEIFWFSMEVRLCDFPSWWQFPTNLQLGVASLETLAQALLLHFRRQSNCGAVRTSAWVSQQCDNMGTVGASCKWLSTKTPMSWALQRLAFCVLQTGSRLRISHVAGVRNFWADSISRLMLPEHSDFEAELCSGKRRQTDLAAFLSEPWRWSGVGSARDTDRCTGLKEREV